MSEDLSPALVLGSVVEIQDEVDGLQVRLQRLDRPAGTETDWMRIVSPSAGPQHGFSFVPDVGDIAVVAFHGRQPYILGFLYGGDVDMPAADPTERTISSTDGNAVVLIDGDKSGITLKDRHGNEIRMDQDGIAITSAKDLTLTATGTTTVKGTTVELNP
jgi:uncharacterized protein involved in type VI secretion and phage assembly